MKIIFTKSFLSQNNQTFYENLILQKFGVIRYRVSPMKENTVILDESLVIHQNFIIHNFLHAHTQFMANP